MPRVAPPPKQKAATRRSRDYLTPDEVEHLSQAARRLGRHGHRDATMILLAFRHGLRVSELVALKWEQVNLKEGTLSPQRRKHGLSTIHPLWGPEMRALRQMQRDYPETPYVFVSERKAPMTTRTFQNIVARAGVEAGITFPVNAHALRHACGYKLANDGQDTRAIGAYLGHRNLQSTVRYTEVSSRRFRNFWQD